MMRDPAAEAGDAADARLLAAGLTPWSLPVLIGRAAWPHFALIQTRRFLQDSSLDTAFNLSLVLPVVIAEGPHLFPFRTQKLSPPAPMVLPW